MSDEKEDSDDEYEAEKDGKIRIIEKAEKPKKDKK